MACEGSSYTRTAKRSLGVYDLIAAAEWRELTSRSSALEQTERTHDRSTQASQSYANANKQGRLCQTRQRFGEWSRRAPSDIDGQAKGRVSGSERVKRPMVSALDV